MRSGGRGPVIYGARLCRLSVLIRAPAQTMQAPLPPVSLALFSVMCLPRDLALVYISLYQCYHTLLTCFSRPPHTSNDVSHRFILYIHFTNRPYAFLVQLFSNRFKSFKSLYSYSLRRILDYSFRVFFNWKGKPFHQRLNQKIFSFT